MQQTVLHQPTPFHHQSPPSSSHPLSMLAASCNRALAGATPSWSHALPELPSSLSIQKVVTTTRTQETHLTRPQDPHLPLTPPAEQMADSSYQYAQYHNYHSP